MHNELIYKRYIYIYIYVMESQSKSMFHCVVSFGSMSPFDDSSVDSDDGSLLRDDAMNNRFSGISSFISLLFWCLCCLAVASSSSILVKYRPIAMASIVTAK